MLEYYEGSQQLPSISEANRALDMLSSVFQQSNYQLMNKENDFENCL